MANIPSELQYTREHEWVRIEGDLAILGITEYAQRELGEVVFVELPQVGQRFEAGDECGTIESVKAVSQLYVPFAGEIVDVNQGVQDDPELLNEDPYGEGWLLRVRLGAGAVGGLMSAEAYNTYISAAED